MSQSSSEDEALVVGYLIERGYRISPSHAVPSHDVMDRTWHWRGFELCLAERRLGAALNDLMNDLAGSERVAWIVIEGPGKLVNAGVPYTGMETLDRIKELVDRATSDQWVSVMLGVKFAREQCVRFSKAEILREFSRVLGQADKIARVVENAVP